MEMRVSRLEQSQCGTVGRKVVIMKGSLQEVAPRSTSGEEGTVGTTRLSCYHNIPKIGTWQTFNDVTKEMCMQWMISSPSM